MSVNPGRKRITMILTCCFTCLILITGCAEKPSSTDEAVSPAVEEAQPYFGLDFPSSTVSRFAPALFRKELHAPPIFTPDGREVYWSSMDEPRGVRFMTIENGAWSEPAPAPFDRGGQGDSPFISSDGTRLLYLSYGSNNEAIWQVEREDDGWGSPQILPTEVNQNGAHWQASMADNGNLYFGSKGEIFFAEFVNGSYTQAQKLNSSFNTPDAHEGSPFIAPDESYLIFDRAPTSSYADLYITFRNESGGWEDPVAMDSLNTGAHELYANVSPDGRFIIFLSNRTGGIQLPYWVDADIIEDYRTQN